MEHSNTVIQFQDSDNELVEAIGDLYHDAMARHLQLQSHKMAKDSVADAGWADTNWQGNSRSARTTWCRRQDTSTAFGRFAGLS